MNSAPFAVHQKKDAAGNFLFFRPDLRHSPARARSARAVDKDPLTQQFPTDRQTGGSCSWPRSCSIWRR
jgi:hypothetical protein